MMKQAPTKGNLLAAKRSRALAKNGFELMDRKRNILIRELMGLVGRAQELQARIDETFQEAYSALRDANISMGGCEEVAEAMSIDDSVRVRYRSVMGVEMPLVTSEPGDLTVLPYGLTDTTSDLDAAYIKFSGVKALCVELAEVENCIYRLAYAIKKTQKRANALDNVVIPGLDIEISRISDELEEKEREEFVRQKIIKAQKQKKKRLKNSK